MSGNENMCCGQLTLPFCGQSVANPPCSSSCRSTVSVDPFLQSDLDPFLNQIFPSPWERHGEAFRLPSGVTKICAFRGCLDPSNRPQGPPTPIFPLTPLHYRRPLLQPDELSPSCDSPIPFAPILIIFCAANSPINRERNSRPFKLINPDLHLPRPQRPRDQPVHKNSHFPAKYATQPSRIKHGYCSTVY